MEPGDGPLAVMILFAIGAGVLGYLLTCAIALPLTCALSIKRKNFEIAPHIFSGFVVGIISVVSSFIAAGVFSESTALILGIVFAIGFISSLASWVLIVIPEQLRAEDLEESGQS